MSPGKGLEVISWKTSSGRLPEYIFRTSPRRRLDDVLKKISVTSTSDQSKTSLMSMLKYLWSNFVFSITILCFPFSFPAVYF